MPALFVYLACSVEDGDGRPVDYALRTYVHTVMVANSCMVRRY